MSSMKFLQCEVKVDNLSKKNRTYQISSADIYLVSTRHTFLSGKNTQLSFPAVSIQYTMYRSVLGYSTRTYKIMKVLQSKVIKVITFLFSIFKFSIRFFQAYHGMPLHTLLGINQRMKYINGLKWILKNVNTSMCCVLINVQMSKLHLQFLL